jgi:hypothetical protein
MWCSRRSTIAHADEVDHAAVGVHRRGQDAPRRITRAHQHRPRPVGEDHARRAILPVEVLAQQLGADHQHVPHAPVDQELLGHRLRVEEAGAARGHVERRRVDQAELVLHGAGRGRDRHVGRHGRQHDQVDVLGRNARRGERLPAGLARVQ